MPKNSGLSDQSPGSYDAAHTAPPPVGAEQRGLLARRPRAWRAPNERARAHWCVNAALRCCEARRGAAPLHMGAAWKLAAGAALHLAQRALAQMSRRCRRPATTAGPPARRGDLEAGGSGNCAAFGKSRGALQTAEGCCLCFWWRRRRAPALCSAVCSEAPRGATSSRVHSHSSSQLLRVRVEAEGAERKRLKHRPAVHQAARHQRRRQAVQMHGYAVHRGRRGVPKRAFVSLQSCATPRRGQNTLPSAPVVALRATARRRCGLLVRVASAAAAAPRRARTRASPACCPRSRACVARTAHRKRSVAALR